MRYKNYYSLVNIKNTQDYISNVIKDINKIINEKKVENKLIYIKEIYDQIIINNIITMKYKIDSYIFESKGIKKLDIFGKIFVEKNKDNYQIIINGKNHELTQYLNIEEL